MTNVPKQEDPDPSAESRRRIATRNICTALMIFVAIPLTAFLAWPLLTHLSLQNALSLVSVLGFMLIFFFCLATRLAVWISTLIFGDIAAVEAEQRYNAALARSHSASATAARQQDAGNFQAALFKFIVIVGILAIPTIGCIFLLALPKEPVLFGFGLLSFTLSMVSFDRDRTYFKTAALVYILVLVPTVAIATLLSPGGGRSEDDLFLAALAMPAIVAIAVAELRRLSIH